MENNLIRLSKSSISNDEKQAVMEVLDKEYLGMGEKVNAFEKNLSKFFGRTAICVSSGTSALQLALESCGFNRGDQVLLPTLTYVASFQAITAAGLIPIACDINCENLLLDLSKLKNKINIKTKAIMPVHYSGDPGNLNDIYDFAYKYNLRVIEDAAHAFGSFYKGKLIGNFGDISCFSFDGIKNITSGEGGCIVSNDKNLIKLVKDKRLLGISKDSEMRYINKRSWEFNVNTQGWRYHMSDIMAAIGISQLNKFYKFAKIRKKIAKIYDEEFLSVHNVKTFKRDYDQIVPHIYVIRVPGLKNRKKLRDYLLENGIQTGIHYNLNHTLSFFKKFNQERLEQSEKIFNEILTLPLHTDITERDVKFVVNSIKEFLR
tara:strand:- start:2878 stop:4002 length:1125 start_codon:yes stop_codon:yes gene_type:complete